MFHSQLVMKRGSTGMTLVEVMVATVLLTLVLGGGIAALIQGNRMIADARDMTRVSQIVQSEIEALRTMTWTDLEAMPNRVVELPLRGSFADRFSDKYQLYRYVTDHNSAQKGVHVFVIWQSLGGEERRQGLYTRFTKGGLNDYYYRAF